MIHFKLPPRKCNDCNYHASGGAFKKTFGKWWWGKEKCPECGSYNIGDREKPLLAPAPQPIR